MDGVLATEIVDQIQVDQSELSKARWVSIEEAGSPLDGRVSRRFDAVAPLLGAGSALYLEDPVAA
jgi:NADH pyrophosphatase NudC (nudix superfamily)